MIKPTGFTYNAETAENNHFQNPISNQNQKQISEKALREFDNLVYKLDTKGINITVLEPKDNQLNPDAVFPNNWFSIHKDGTKVLYPMFAKSRRKERDLEIFNLLEKNLNFKIKSTVDLTIYEQENLYLEGTGSLILDRENKIAYAALSERTSKKILVDFGQKMNYNIVYFNALHTVNHMQSPIYHTNVMMCLGDSFSVICLETIYDQLEKVKVLDSLEKTNKEVIEITADQMNNFAGNMLQVIGANNSPIIVMSQSAFESLNKSQLKKLEKFGEILFSDLSTIENYGGGSARCMMAELFY
jgi:hypothetical protein